VTTFNLPPGEIHLWSASLDVSDEKVVEMRLLLNSRELERADRFRVPNAARRFITARAVLRTLIGRMTDTDPAEVEFSYSEQGKPSVTGGPCFNSSDSGDTVIVAVAHAEIGVDVEGLRTLPNPDRLARRICTDRELEQLAAIPDHESGAALLRLWTFKEAALKAVGLGLPGGLRNVEVDFQPGEPPRLLRLCDDRGTWSLMPAEVDHSFLCSVVVRETGWRLNVRELPPQSV